MNLHRTVLLSASAALLVACASKHTVAPPPAPRIATQAAAPAPTPRHDAVPRETFNRLAVELDLPLFWTSDANGDGRVDPAEVAHLWGFGKREEWVRGGVFTPAFEEAYSRIALRQNGAPQLAKALEPAEQLRRQKILEELAQGRPTLIASDLSALSREDVAFARKIVEASLVIERLYARQMGIHGMESRIPEDDTASRAAFFRNQGIRCQAPRTQSDKACSALPGAPAGKLSGLYPASLLGRPGFCEELAKKDPALMDPFVVVAEGAGGVLEAVPYTRVYAEDMARVARLLDEAAAAMLDPKETALVAYLKAAARSFRDNDWVPADEAWARMNVSNSRWYLRIGPDEVYEEPCSTKALFHVSFGRINQGSLKWQSLLEPLKTEMEQTLARLAGKAYRARPVTFHLPDFVDIILNAGDSRSPMGATIGQSLPNFGPVANEGRGRTVAMTNFYTDPDSLAASKTSAESLLCAGAMSLYTSDPEPGLMSTVLHEAAHNLGPAHQFKVKGKTDREVFGGPLASTLEELKAQTAALYFTDWLVAKKQITREEADRAHLRDLLWGFGHIARGMYDDEGHPKNYSQLAAIQLGWLMSQGAVAWNAQETAANGRDTGCFAVVPAKYPAAIESLMKESLGIKARGDRKRAEKLLAEHVEAAGEKKALRDVIVERVLRSPKQSFVYSIRFE